MIVDKELHRVCLNNESKVLYVNVVLGCPEEAPYRVVQDLYGRVEYQCSSCVGSGVKVKIGSEPDLKCLLYAHSILVR